MSKSDATRFLADLTSGKLVIDATEILSKGSHTDMHEYAKSYGYDFTKEEILDAAKQQEIFDSEVTEEDMEAIAGGSTPPPPPPPNVVIVTVVVVVATASAAASCL